MHDIFARREPTYERLTKEFLSSLIYTVSPNTASTIGTVKFRMFNVEYEYTTDALAELLDMPHGEGFICETPLDSDWSIEAFAFWARLSSSTISSFEGILASMIHNPTIRVFRYLLACTIFSRENPNKVNAKELLFLQGSLTGLKINVFPFMIAQMSSTLRKGGVISFGGLITSIARALNLDTELATLVPLPNRIINLKFLKDMKLCKVRKEGGFNLMIHGVAIPSVALPCSRRTDVLLERNWTYDLSLHLLGDHCSLMFLLGTDMRLMRSMNRETSLPFHICPPTMIHQHTLHHLLHIILQVLPLDFTSLRRCGASILLERRGEMELSPHCNSN